MAGGDPGLGGGGSPSSSSPGSWRRAWRRLDPEPIQGSGPPWGQLCEQGGPQGGCEKPPGWAGGQVTKERARVGSGGREGSRRGEGLGWWGPGGCGVRRVWGPAPGVSRGCTGRSALSRWLETTKFYSYTSGGQRSKMKVSAGLGSSQKLWRTIPPRASSFWRRPRPVARRPVAPPLLPLTRLLRWPM